MLDQQTAKNLAKQFKIDIFTIYREYLQIIFLKYFYQQKSSEKNYFKGGTALRLLFKSFRFSEDLDFTSLLSIKEIPNLLNNTLSDINKEIPEINFKKIKTIQGFSGKISQQLPDYNFPLTIKLDFSFREKPQNTNTSYLETIFPVSPYPQISHFTIEEIMAEKVRAVLTRTKGRDIFDLWFILSKNISLDWELINKKTAFYKITTNLKKLIHAVEKFDQKQIEQDLNKFLPLSHRKLSKEIKKIILHKLQTTTTP